MTLRWWVGLVAKRAISTIILFFAATIGIAYFAALNIGINTNTEDMLSPDLPFRQNSKALNEAFPQLNDNIVVVLDAGNADLLADAAKVLTTELKKSPALFGEVFDPEGLPFFVKNGFLYLDEEELVDLTQRLNDAQPFIGRLWNDPTLPGLFDVFRLVVKEIGSDGNAPGQITLGDLLGSTARVIEAQISGSPKRMSWREIISGSKNAAARKFRTIVIQPRLDYASLQPGTDAINRLRQLFLKLELKDRYGVRARLTGSVALEQEELESVVDGLGIAGALSISLVIILLIWGLKSVRLAAAVLLTLISGLLWTAGFAALAVGTLNLISVAFAVLFIGLSVDFGIHYTLRYKEAVLAGIDTDAALIEAAGDIGNALILSAVAAAIGFLAFVPTDYVGLKELGVIASGGMAVALFANLTLLPAILAASGGAAIQDVKSHVPSLKGASYLWTRPVGIAVGVAGLIGLALIPKVGFDFDPLNLKDENTESVSALFDLMAATDQGPYTIEILASNLTQAAKLSKRIEKLSSVKSAITLNSLIPGDQNRKLEIIETLGFTIAPSLSIEPERTISTHQERLAAITSFISLIDNKDYSGLGGNLAEELKNISRALKKILQKSKASPSILKELEHRLVATLPERLRELRTALDTSNVDVGALPQELKSRQLAKDGRAKIVVVPKFDMTDRAALKIFVSEVRAIAPNAAGSPVTILEAGRVVVNSFIQAAGLSFALIALLVLIVTRALKEILYIFAPLIVAASLTMAVSVLADLPFNFANVIVLPLLFGLGIASAIHILMREKNLSEKLGAMATSTPRAVVFSALTTVGSFASIAISSHPGTASMGVLLTVAISLTLISTLTVLPALLSTWPLKKDRR